MGTRLEWADDFLRELGYGPGANNVPAVLAWMRSEFGGSTPIPAAFNPLATTLPAAGTTDFNSVGVKNYPDWQTGVQACAATLLQDHPGYDAIRSHLSTDGDFVGTVDAISASAWGSHPSGDYWAEVTQHPERNADLFLGDRPGADPAPAPAPGPGVAVGRIDMPEIAQGSSGDAVRDAQSLLGATADGAFGPLTDASVREFQGSAGLTIDGIVGPQTWTGLVQRAVGATVDGVYGPETTADVEAYQTHAGLAVDGIAGPITVGSLAGH